MKKFSLRVSGSRVGDSARPTESAAPTALIKAPRFGLKVHREKGGPTPISAQVAQKRGPTPFSPDDVATAEDYE
jgi:hypothetical protein